MEFKDYYGVLGVPHDATADQIKKAYRQKARKFHPDVSKEPDAAARMSEVNEAHAVLSDPERRAAYDAVGRGHRPGEAFTPPPGWDAGFEFSGPGAPSMDAGEFSDFFAELFGRMGAGRSGRAHQRAPGGGTASGFRQRGDDHHAKIVLDLIDAWRGANRQISLQAPEFDAQGHLSLRQRTLDVRIPAGVRPGQLIRLAGQGAPGAGGGLPGDLFLEVVIRDQPPWRLDDHTLVGDLAVAPWEAALGAVVAVPMPDGGQLRVRVPAGAQGGRRLTVRGKGWPGATPGDLELVVRVVLPSAFDPRARQLYEQMAQALPDFDARKVAAADAAREE